MPEKIRALACLVFAISTVIHVFITHCVVSRDWDEIAYSKVPLTGLLDPLMRCFTLSSGIVCL